MRRLFSFLPKSVVITGARRTPIGSYMGSLKSLLAPTLGAIAIKAAVADANVQPDLIDEAILGCAVQGGIKQNPTKQAIIGAGLPSKIITSTVSKVCSSGMKALTMSAQAIALGHANIIVTGGFESVSNGPFLIPNPAHKKLSGDSDPVDSVLLDGLTCPFTGNFMGHLMEKTNEKYGMKRQEQDEYAIESFKRTADAWSRGLFKKEIVPCVIEDAETGTKTIVEEDEEYKKANFPKMIKLRPAFRSKGTITAGNASKINDGAAALIFASEEAAKATGQVPLARIISFADVESDPEEFSIMPKFAIEKALKNAGLKLDQIDLFEINEAFSSSVLLIMRFLNLSHDKVNVRGGGISIGHALGCTGARIVISLLSGLKERNKKLGVASVCNGGGGATAIVIEAL